MPDFATRLADGASRAWRRLELALVPIVLGALDVERIRSVLAFDGVHVGIRFGAPGSVVTGWQFVSVPGGGVNVELGVPISGDPLALTLVPVLLVVQAFLAAGYFGSIRQDLYGEEYRFADSARRHFVPFLALAVLPVVAMAPIALWVLGFEGTAPSGAVVVFLLAIPVFLAVGYLFFATPYLVVLRDAGFLDAARASYSLATAGGPYLSYFLGYIGFTALVSPFATGIVVNVPVLGLIVGVVGGGLLGYAANVATMRFVADVDPETAPPVEWDGEDATSDRNGDA